MEVSYATMIAMGTLVQRLGRDAQRYQAALAEAVNESTEWKRIADELKAERNAAKQEAVSARQDAVTRAEADRKRIDGLMIQAQDMRAEIERLKKPRQHPVAVGEWVRRTDAECDGIYFRRGVIAQVIDIHDAPEKQYTVSRPEWNGYCVPWAMQYCEPCDPPEATHDTPAGKQAAESAIKREPKPGDVVRLIRQCEGWDPIWGRIGDLGTVLRITTYPQGPKGVTIREKGGLDWPLSCVEIVEDAK